MGIIANPTRNENSISKVEPRKSFADTKRWISNEFYQALNRHVETESGMIVTYAQQMVQSVVEMATSPDKDDYVKLAASKFIIEHLEGKASAMQTEDKQEMPKLVICVQGTSTDEIREKAKELEGVEPKEDILVEISDENGDNKEERLV